MDDVLIRPATLNDATTVYNFICTLEETVLDSVPFHTIYRQNLESPTIYYIVAEQADNVIGFISCHTQHLLHHGGRVGEIQELFVRPDKRGLGIGHRLVAAITDLAESKEFVNLEVTTNQKRTETIRFYQQQSFQLSHYKLVKPIKS